MRILELKCWTHLLRVLREGAKQNLSPEYRSAHRRLRRIFLDARRLARARMNLPAGAVLRRYRLLSEHLMKRGAAPYRNKTPRRLSERILKHHHQLLTFLKQPGLASDNHQAERLIRPYVIIRKRSYRSRSPSGAAIHSALTSWVQTLALQGKAIGPTLGGAYARHRQGDPTPLLLPAG